jgi:hypothetical protein
MHVHYALRRQRPGWLAVGAWTTTPLPQRGVKPIEILRIELGERDVADVVRRDSCVALIAR